MKAASIDLSIFERLQPQHEKNATDLLDMARKYREQSFELSHPKGRLHYPALTLMRIACSSGKSRTQEHLNELAQVVLADESIRVCIDERYCFRI
jgi:hypothetical protein